MLTEALRTLETHDKALRLFVLDDLWTDALVSPLSERDRLDVAVVGREMQALLAYLRDEAPIVRDFILRDPDAFDSSAERAVAESPLANDVKQRLREEFQALGWSAELDVSLRYVEQHADSEIQELGEKLSELAEGSEGQGDIAPWFKCCLRVAIFGTSIGCAILAGGAPALLALSVGGSVLGLADGLPGCMGAARRSPNDAEVIAQLAGQRSSGKITELEFRRAKRKLLGLPPNAAEDLQIEIDGFSPALTRPMEEPRKLDPKKGRT